MQLDGFAVQLLFLLFMINMITFGFFYLVLQGVQKQAERAIVIAVIVTAGLLILAMAGQSPVMFFEFFLISPVAVLVPVYFIPGVADRTTGFARVLACQILVTIIGAVCLLLVTAAYMSNPSPYAHDLIGKNLILYICVLVGGSLLTMLLLRIMRDRNIFPAKTTEKTHE